MSPPPASPAPMDTDPPPNPLKRKSPPTDDPPSPHTRVDLDPDDDADADGDAEPEPEPDVDPDERSFTPPSGGEYESGHVTCEVCGLSVSFRDEETGGFSLREWNDHRETCVAPTGDGAPPPAQAPPSPVLALATSVPAKRRRAKRTEDERKAYLGSDPNSKNVYALEERNALFSKDPDVRKFDAERVLCNICDNWFPLNPDNHLHAVQTWLQHRAACQSASTAPPASTSSSTSPQLTSTSLTTPKQASTSPKSEDVQILTLPPPSTNIPAQPKQGHPSPRSQPQPRHSPSEGSRGLSPPFHDLNPANYAPAHESRRRNAEQRAATLRADKLIAEVEPNRVFCSLCQKWVQLRQDSSYCAYPWLQHRGKCLARHQRRAAKAAEVAEAKARKLGQHHHHPSQPHQTQSHHPPPSHHLSHPPHSYSHPSHPHPPHSASHPPHRSHRDDRPRIQSLSDRDLDSEDEHTQQRRDDDEAAHEAAYRRERERERERRRDAVGASTGPPPAYAHRDKTRTRPSSSSFHSGYHSTNGTGTAPTNGSGSGGAVNGHGHGHTSGGGPYRHGHSGSSSAAAARVIRAWNADVPPGPDADGEGDDIDVDVDADGELEHSPAPASRPSSSHAHRPSHHSPRLHPAHAHPHAHPHTHTHAPPPPPPPAHAATKRPPLNLDSSSGRRHFIAASIAQLRSTTYEPQDEMSVSALLTYLNAAVPADKYEDFDTAEVVRALGVLRERGRVRLEGDLIW
ncbi:hypothetical protein H0H87_006589 [Tephrocybe sp. NHM501043]|nr:hypothetical protein H0H87_006589 [Tephrocybe sp. NHM501043]